MNILKPIELTEKQIAVFAYHAAVMVDYWCSASEAHARGGRQYHTTYLPALADVGTTLRSDRHRNPLRTVLRVVHVPEEILDDLLWRLSETDGRSDQDVFDRRSCSGLARKILKHIAARAAVVTEHPDGTPIEDDIRDEHG